MKRATFVVYLSRMLLPQKNKFVSILNSSLLYIQELACAIFVLYLLLETIEILLPFSISTSINLSIFTWLCSVAILSVFLIRFYLKIVGDEATLNYQPLAFTYKNKNIPLILFAIILLFLFVAKLVWDLTYFNALVASLISLSVILSWLYLLDGSKHTMEPGSNIGLKSTPFKIFRKIVYFLTLVIVFVFYVQSFIPFGKLSVSLPLDGHSNRLTSIVQQEQLLRQLKDSGELEYALAINNPLKFTVNVPRPFRKATAHLTYKPSSTDGEVLLGSVNQFGSMSYAPFAKYYSTLEKLPPYWSAIREGDYVLWQKDVESQERIQMLQTNRDEKIFQIESNYSEELNKSVVAEQLGDITKEDLERRKAELVASKEQEIFDVTSSINNEFQEGNKSRYASIDEFINDAGKDFKRIVALGQSIDGSFVVDATEESESSFRSVKSSRGSLSLLIYQKVDSDLECTFHARDANRFIGEDPITITLTKEDKPLKAVTTADDGNATDDNVASPFNDIQFSYTNLKKGLYRINISADEDIFFDQIEISSPYVAYENSYYSTDNAVYEPVIGGKKLEPIVLYTNGTKLSIATSHEEGLQTIQVGNQRITLDETHTAKQVGGLQGITRIYLPKGDVKLISDGILSEKYSSPLLRYWHYGYDKISNLEELDGIEYVYAYYPRPQVTSDGWFFADASLEAPHVGFQNNTATFTIDFGKLGIDSRSVKIKSIELTFEKDPITVHKVISKIRGLFTK